MWWTLSAALLVCFSLLGCSTAPRPPLAMIPVLLEPSGTMPLIRQDLYHEVAPLETLWRISKMYDVDQAAITRANRLRNPSSLSVGQRLFIPQAAAHRSVIPLYRTRPWSYIVVHHSATEVGNALTIDRAHHRRGFWEGLGYHFLIDNGTLGKGAGQIEIGPRWIKQQDGAHCNAGGMNEQGIGICLVGNFSNGPVAKEQFESLVFLVRLLSAHYQIPLDQVIRHRDVPGKDTECPGNLFPWHEFKERLTAP